jgi:3-deoxy-D-manno-octulosonate 8-phosphate phosphatase KdsC-like HAD superfamily phosphatase
LRRLAISPHNVVAVGDAENDHPFLDACGVAAAVENALPALKERCDLVLTRDHGQGVVELIDRIVSNDLQDLGTRRPRSEVAARSATA